MLCNCRTWTGNVARLTQYWKLGPEKFSLLATIKKYKQKFHFSNSKFQAIHKVNHLYADKHLQTYQGVYKIHLKNTNHEMFFGGFKLFCNYAVLCHDMFPICPLSTYAVTDEDLGFHHVLIGFYNNQHFIYMTKYIKNCSPSVFSQICIKYTSHFKG